MDRQATPPPDQQVSTHVAPRIRERSERHEHRNSCAQEHASDALAVRVLTDGEKRFVADF